jgi:N-acetylglucosaminyl-diphospho-decaprenol L-rhamnosyltransferase
MSFLAAVVVSYESRDDLLRCLASLRDDAGMPVQIVVVDNASTDGSAAAARDAFPEATVVEAGANLGFGAANNLGLRHTDADLVLLLNPDAELRPGALRRLCDVLEERPQVVAVGPRTLNEDGTPQVSFGPRLTLASEWRQRRLVRGVRVRHPQALAEAAELTARPGSPAWLSASCLLVRRAALLAVGGFDERFFLYEEDVDLGYRLRAAGGELSFEPTAEVVHRLGRSAARDPRRVRLEYHRSHLLLYRKHNPAWERLALRLTVAGRALGQVLRGDVDGGRELLRVAAGRA